GGAVGARSTQTLSKALAQLKEVLGESPEAQYIYEQLEAAYQRHETYGMATADYVHQLFGRYGLLVLDMARPAFKRAFVPIMEEELFEQASQAYIEAAQAQLEAVGFSGQAHAREINLFYLGQGYRERIVKEGDTYLVLNQDLQFSAAQLREELRAHPERFSPNVIMRPLFQELILPNLAYVGGGGEIAYWLERKEQFAHFGIPFPMLIRRNSLLWLDRGNCQRMDKLGLTVEDLFQDTDALIRAYVTKSAQSELTIAEEKAQLESLFQSIANKARDIDPTLAKAILAEYTRQAKSLDNLEGRLLRAEKQKHETALNQIRKLKEKLFPNNGLQERYDNFLNFYPRYGDRFFEILLTHLDPLTEGFVVIADRD
ncbi:MAG: bacillithiol biosynthesis cysteine-adding enzyme BshC, partial [Bacteroidetes bacterium]